MHFDRDRVRETYERLSTEDLLDLVTIFREGLESEAVAIAEAELVSREVTRPEIDAHEAERWKTGILVEDGQALRCSYCFRPATMKRREWHRWAGIIPLFRREMYYCEVHRPPNPAAQSPERSS